MTPEIRKKISDSLRGKKKTPEHCQNISNAKKGIPNGHKGIKRSLETRRKLSLVRATVPNYDPDDVRNIFRKNLWHNTGISLAQWDEKLIEQSGLCALCNRQLTDKNFQTDHDHATGRFRGILCISCNVCLGWFENRKKSVLDYIRNVAWEKVTKAGS